MLVGFEVIYFSLKNNYKCLYMDICEDHNWAFIIIVLLQKKSFT